MNHTIPQPAPAEKKYCDHWVVCKHAHALLYCPVDATGVHHKECEYDTRSRPHTPAPDNKIITILGVPVIPPELIQEGNRLSIEIEKALKEHDQRIRQQARDEVLALIKEVSDGLNNDAVNDEDYGRWMTRFISQGCACTASKMNSPPYPDICDFSCIAKKLEDDNDRMERICQKMQTLRQQQGGKPR